MTSSRSARHALTTPAASAAASGTRAALRAERVAQARAARRRKFAAPFIGVAAMAAVAVTAVALIPSQGSALADATASDVAQVESQDYQVNLVTGADTASGAETLADPGTAVSDARSGDGATVSLMPVTTAPNGKPTADYIAKLQAMAADMVAAKGWSTGEFQCLVTLYNGESSWNPLAENSSSGAYGLPQALPADKMSTHGTDWATNPQTQIAWGLDYIKSRYGTPCAALSFWNANSPHWY